MGRRRSSPGWCRGYRGGVRRFLVAAAAAASALAAAGCGLNIQSADLFVLTRTGQGQRIRLLVSDDGAVRCNGRSPKMLPDSLLLEARDLAGSLKRDARKKLTLPSSPGTVFRYTVRLQGGRVSFPDTAGARHPVLARTELFTLQAARTCAGHG